MAEKTSWSGAALAETDINTYLRHTGGAFNTWTPTVTQGSSVAATVNHATYWRAGRLIVAKFSLSITGTGTAATDVLISLPVTAASGTTGIRVGDFAMGDASTGFSWFASPYIASTSAMALQRRVDGAAAGFLGTSGFTAALASGDNLVGLVIYEAAS